MHFVNLCVLELCGVYYCFFFLFIMTSFFFIPQTKLANGTSSMIVPKQRKLSANYEKEKELCVKYFEQWSECDQVEFVEHLISRMCHYQHGHINTYLKPMLQRDFITALPGKMCSIYAFI